MVNEQFKKAGLGFLGWFGAGIGLTCGYRLATWLIGRLF